MDKGDLDERQYQSIQQFGFLSRINIRNHTFKGQVNSHASKQQR